jgi:hypothetical protein
MAHEGGIKQPREKITVAPSQNLLIVAAHQRLVLLQIHAGILPSRSRARQHCRPAGLHLPARAGSRAAGQLTLPRACPPCGTDIRMACRNHTRAPGRSCPRAGPDRRGSRSQAPVHSPRRPGQADLAGISLPAAGKTSTHTEQRAATCAMGQGLSPCQQSSRRPDCTGDRAARPAYLYITAVRGNARSCRRRDAEPDGHGAGSHVHSLSAEGPYRR